MCVRRCILCTRTGAARIPTFPPSHIATESHVSTLTNSLRRFITYLPPLAQPSETLKLDLTRMREELTIHHTVQEPVPVFICDVRNEPREAFAVKPYL